MGQIWTIQTSWMLRLSHAHLCSEHFAECDSVNFMAEYQMGFVQSGMCRTVHRVNDLEKKSSSNLLGWSWRAASAQHDTENWDIHWYPETNANKAKTKTQMPTAEKAVKERDRTQMPVAKKERTDHKCLAKVERPNHKCWWKTKNGCSNQAS